MLDRNRLIVCALVCMLALVVPMAMSIPADNDTPFTRLLADAKGAIAVQADPHHAPQQSRTGSTLRGSDAETLRSPGPTNAGRKRALNVLLINGRTAEPTVQSHFLRHATLGTSVMSRH